MKRSAKVEQFCSSQRQFDHHYFTEVCSTYMTDVRSWKANYILLTDATCPLLVAYDLNKGSHALTQTPKLNTSFPPTFVCTG